jgi:LysR family transcriptional regulator of gallate degradation
MAQRGRQTVGAQQPPCCRGNRRSQSLVSIGALPLSRAFLVPGAMAAMVAEQTKARFEIIEGDRHELIEPLRDGIIDIVLGALPAHTDEEDLVQLPLYTERLVIVAGSQHPLVGKPTPSISALMNHPWIVAPPNSPLRSHWEQLFGARELPPRPIECGSVMIIGRLLTSGNFLTLLSQDQVALQIRSGLLARVGKPLADQACTIGMTTRRGWKPTAVQRRFIELLDAVAATKRTSETGGSARLNLDLCWN